MSGNTFTSTGTDFTCRDRYFNYGSYLRSRGYDKEICNLITAIEQGQFPIGPIYPGNCNSNTRKSTVIKGNVDIVPCQATDNTSLSNLSGQLSVTGGFIGAGNLDPSGASSSFSHQAKGFGIQSNTGISSIGPIYQQTDCNHSNWFGAKNHLFVGGYDTTGAQDCSTNVYIRGSLFVDGSSIELGGFIGETLTLIQGPANNALGTINTFKNPLSNGNQLNMYANAFTTVQAASGADQWKNYLAFAIDGNSQYTQTDVSFIDASAGMSNVMGHMRGFRGLTITNPPLGGPVDIEWNPDISGTSRAIDAYGSIRVQPGNSNALGNIDISGGQFRIFQNDISNVVLSANGDASFNGRVSCYDLSVSNIATFGASTTYIDTSNVNTSYVTVDNSLNTKFIYAPQFKDLYINAFDGGTYSDIYMTALDIFMDADLSVNDVSSSNINNVGSIVTNDISVNSHASIYDLSVGTITIVNGEFNDISVNNHAFINDLSVGTITIVNGEFTDLSVNKHTSINDLSVNGFSEFTGNFLINNITGGSEAITIQTNHGTNEKITIWNQQGDKDDSILIKSSSSTGGVNISAGSSAPITFSAKDIIMSNSDLSAGDISANNIQALGYITSGGDINTTSSINALSANITDLLTAGSGNISDLSVNTLQSIGNDLTIKAGITGARDITFSASDIIMSSSDLSAGDISANNIQALGYITTAGAITSTGLITGVGLTTTGAITATNQTIASGAITSTGDSTMEKLTVDNVVIDGSTVTASGNVTALNFILDSGGGNLIDLSSNVGVLDTSVNLLDASMALVEQTEFIRMRKTNASSNTISNVPNNSASAWTEIDLNATDQKFGSIAHSGSTEFKISKKGLYSYNIQLSLTASGTGFTVDRLELALTNGGSTSAFTITDINRSGRNLRGGFNKEFSEQYRSFSGGDKCFISGNGVGVFEATDLLRIYLRWSATAGAPGAHTFDTNDQDGTIVTFTLIQALE
jgi:hypothetical protein